MSPNACRKAFQNDELDYDNPQYSSIAIRISEEDYLLDDTSFTTLSTRKTSIPNQRRSSTIDARQISGGGFPKGSPRRL